MECGLSRRTVGLGVDTSSHTRILEKDVQSLIDRGALGNSGTDRMRRICNFRMSEVIQQVFQSLGPPRPYRADLVNSSNFAEWHHDHGCILPKIPLGVDVRYGTVDCL